MRRSGSWMTIWDDRILEYARENDVVSPMVLEETGYFDISKSQISRRLVKLEEENLLRRVGNGVYIITERGEGYLDGEVSTIRAEPDEIRDSSDSDSGAASGPETPGEI